MSERTDLLCDVIRHRTGVSFGPARGGGVVIYDRGFYGGIALDVYDTKLLVKHLLALSAKGSSPSPTDAGEGGGT